MIENRKEVEVFGVNYERYAVSYVQKKIAQQFHIKNVCELPAYGEKAMPSIYSLGFGLAGRKVLLVNGREDYKKEWDKLGIGDLVRFSQQEDICHTNIKSNSFNFVWNFAFLPKAENKDELINEMKRISNKYVAIFSVNGGNVGYYVHSALHKINKIPWTHGDKKYNYRNNVADLLEKHDLKIVKKGYVDCPVWPDSLGFRDMRLHRNNITFENVDWESPFTEMVRSNNFPTWLKLVHKWERIPMFPIIKTLYSHIFYVIAEKNI